MSSQSTSGQLNSTFSAPDFHWVFSESGPLELLPTNLNVLLSAGVAWQNSSADHFGNIWHPTNPQSIFIDSGGYQAVSRWDGEYPYSPRELFAWAEKRNADYVAMMDLVCDPDIDSSLSIQERINQTVANADELQSVYVDGDYSFDLVPVIQGWTPNQYLECVDKLRDRGIETDFMGVGSVCRKHAHDKIYRVVNALNAELPSTDFHLFGVKLQILSDSRFWGTFESCDSAAWRFRPSELGRDMMYANNKAEKVHFFYIYRSKIQNAISQMTNQTTLLAHH